jgi:SAM-dependent methyltransferase
VLRACCSDLGLCGRRSTIERQSWRWDEILYLLGVADAFGTALLDWVRGGTVPETIQRDDGYVEEGAGPDAYLAGLAAWPAAERRSLVHVRGRVADLGCGAGRTSVVLQQRGFDVVGLDVSALAVRAARIFGVHAARLASASAFHREISEFDTVVMFGNNFGMFGTPERARQLLSRWATRAAPGTRILAESTSAYGGGAPITDRGYYRRNKELGLAPGHTRLRIRYGDVTGPWTNWLFVSRAELRQIVRGTGWAIRSIVGEQIAEPYVTVLERS